ncbi:phosphohistidine phosphatase SixA [Cellvibrio japonicus]|uniref:Phosphohistidine phosphatase SixA n=1 Tax=Cellvibrio japonicus (strain Ueda107) TaxID=498211 RepID=B3PHG0_CELJU|nr:phosphohistidine phosphatase SixA [Cellvibrio japonicus]ACE83990.1 phosphohistidine phosphatase SixA [Cellvibrio japonicus Ueda107]QEI12442.1 phosphohistidine phosphatase SixA [Cellvibrio japonicus]QEI16015.1 phosphohistidine phosphatase SixA [Cellvibrio japonicus]QEI19594.1 phosphohistidine phosphatase SixA [Cellvibrio japonicus]
MRLYILRHGQAEAQVTTDEARNLTDKGRADVKRVLEQRHSMIGKLDAIWASSLVRAQQTAAIASGYFPGVGIQTTDMLVPEAEPAALYEWLIQQGDTSSLLLVSHQPLVGRVVNQLCGMPLDFYPMATSSLAALVMEVPAVGLAHLLWQQHADAV